MGSAIFECLVTVAWLLAITSVWGYSIVSVGRGAGARGCGPSGWRHSVFDVITSCTRFRVV